ncbi:MAG: response regulator [Prochloraceae cyanobacterium]|nr:response regulator [Prochloraceae cyanobacterium]
MALVLITDDAAFTRRMIRKAFKDTDHLILEASNGKECLDMCDAHSPDCIILDLLMPELDGFSVLETLQQQGSKVPVIVLSADIQDSIRQKCLDLGAVTMLKKPPSSSQILEAIDRALQN